MGKCVLQLGWGQRRAEYGTEDIEGRHAASEITSCIWILARGVVLRFIFIPGKIIPLYTWILGRKRGIGGGRVRPLIKICDCDRME
jgi:hypothetical protein